MAYTAKNAAGGVEKFAADTNSNGELEVRHRVTSSTLPVGAATEATLATVAKDGTEATGVTAPTGATGIRGWLSSIWKVLSDRLPGALGSAGGVKVEIVAGSGGGGGTVNQGTAGSAAWKVDGSGVTQPISASSLPLPAGAATDTAIHAVRDRLPAALGSSGGVQIEFAAGAPSNFSTEATLASIKTDTGHIPTSPAQEHVSQSSPHAVRLTDGATFYRVTTPADTQPGSNAAASQADGHSVTLGATTDVEASGNGSFVAILKRLRTLLGGGLPGSLVGGRLDVNVGAGSVGVTQGAPGVTAWKVDGSGVTQPVSLSSAPLPTGAATEATLAGVLTTADYDSKVGSLTETAPATDTASSGLNGRLQRIAQRITSLIALLPTSLSNGFFQVSVKETITLPVSASSLPLPTGAATDATLAGVLTTSDFDTKVGSLIETAPTTDTASSGLNGRLQRIAQRLTSLIGLLPTALGGSGGMKVEIVAGGGSGGTASTFGTAVPALGTAIGISDGTNLLPPSPTNPMPVRLVASLALTYVDRSGSLTTGNTPQDMMAANPSRKKLFIQNPSNATEDLWISFTGNASVGGLSSQQLGPGDVWQEDALGVTTQRVSVDAATAGHQWRAMEA